MRVTMTGGHRSRVGGRRSTRSEGGTTLIRAASLVDDLEGLGGAPCHRVAGDLEGRVVLEVLLQHVRLAVGLDFESFGVDGLAYSYPGARGAVHYDSHFVISLVSPP